MLPETLRVFLLLVLLILLYIICLKNIPIFMENYTSNNIIDHGPMGILYIRMDDIKELKLIERYSKLINYLKKSQNNLPDLIILQDIKEKYYDNIKENLSREYPYSYTYSNNLVLSRNKILNKDNLLFDVKKGENTYSIILMDSPKVNKDTHKLYLDYSYKVPETNYLLYIGYFDNPKNGEVYKNLKSVIPKLTDQETSISRDFMLYDEKFVYMDMFNTYILLSKEHKRMDDTREFSSRYFRLKIPPFSVPKLISKDKFSSNEEVTLDTLSMYNGIFTFV